MKFFDFVACCGASVRPAVRPDSSPQPPPPVEEMLSLVRSPWYRRRRKRGRLGWSVSAPARTPAEWKPSLCSISEETVLVVVRSDGRDQDRTAGSERLGKRKSGSRSSRWNVVACFGDDYGRSSFPTVIPAFSPTPFMF
ncbi:hypothetical protein TIFTF001_003328 [Ficus carica]|uniref:Uncharacterized protein n=1 Tax=Ficus carica TaxID=3494 RepID=A0AA88DA54_FICCA|nr:hypothetical protein TIFTF001_003328 [Ficus carica]